MRRPGCPLCRALADAERAWIASFVREGRFAPRARARFFEAGGFCRRHAWMVHRRAAELGTGAAVADLYGNVARRDLAILGDLLRDGRRGRGRRWSLARGDTCLACEHAEQSLERKAAFLAESLREGPVRELYAASDGLCFAHLQAAVEAADDEAARLLLEDWRGRLTKLERLLDEYDRRRDHRYANEPKGDEQGSWTDVIDRYVGQERARRPDVD